MTKQELEKAIENGESVWSIETNYTTLKKFIKEHKFDKDIIDILEPSAFYKTKAEAEHYLNHANITRIEQLPFLTWEEFLKKEYVEFFNDGKGFRLFISYINCDHIRISKYNRYNPDGDVIFEALLTEENFYKAYDECVRLFKGKE